MTLPDPQEHRTVVEVDPALSTPITIKARFQLNLVIRKDSSFPPLQNLPLQEGEVSVLPMLWASEGFHMPDEQGPDSIDFSYCFVWASNSILNLRYVLTAGVN